MDHIRYHILKIILNKLYKNIKHWLIAQKIKAYNKRVKNKITLKIESGYDLKWWNCSEALGN